MQLELVKLYSDGTYEDVGAPTEANVRVIGNNSEQTIYTGSRTLIIGSDETAKAIMLTYSGSDSNNYNYLTTLTCRIGFTLAIAPPNLKSIYVEQNCYLSSGPVG